MQPKCGHLGLSKVTKFLIVLFPSRNKLQMARFVHRLCGDTMAAYGLGFPKTISLSTMAAAIEPVIPHFSNPVATYQFGLHLE